MKSFFSFVVIILASLNLSGQKKDTAILIVPCKTGELFIDGISKGKIEAEDAFKQTLSFGDHYLQLKTDEGKLNTTLNISETISSTIIKIGCEEKSETAIKPNSVRLLDKMVSLSGSLSNNTENSFFGLDEGDDLNIQCEILNKKGTANLSVIQMDNGMTIYRKADFNYLINEKIRIPKKAVYRVILTTGAIFGKEARLVLDRLPSSKSSPDFKSTIHIISDTTPKSLGPFNLHIFSKNHTGTINRSIKKLNLPPGTTYWTFWIGVGQESQNKMKSFVSSLSRASAILSADPLVLFGMKLIPNLPMLNTTSTVSYCFMDGLNSQIFMQGIQQPRRYPIDIANNVSTSYSTIYQYVDDLHICLWNDSMFVGQDVELRIVAFIVRKRVEMDN